MSILATTSANTFDLILICAPTTRLLHPQEQLPNSILSKEEFDLAMRIRRLMQQCYPQTSRKVYTSNLRSTVELTSVATEHVASRILMECRDLNDICFRDKEKVSQEDRVAAYRKFYEDSQKASCTPVDPLWKHKVNPRGYEKVETGDQFHNRVVLALLEIAKQNQKNQSGTFVVFTHPRVIQILKLRSQYAYGRLTHCVLPLDYDCDPIPYGSASHFRYHAKESNEKGLEWIGMKEIETVKVNEEETKEATLINFCKLIERCENDLKRLVDSPLVQQAEAMRKLLSASTTISSMAKLDFSGCRPKLKALPPEIKYFTNLRRLNLSNHVLESLPKEIGCLKRLEELRLNNNRLNSLPPEIGNLSSLKKLYCEINDISVLPASIGLLVVLEELNLTSNKLTALPVEMACLERLAYLYVGNNELDCISPVLLRLRLKHLEVYSNKIRVIPDNINHLTILERFEVDCNPLDTVSQNLASIPRNCIIKISRAQQRLMPYHPRISLD